ncbi:MAG: hypothetical protein RL757_867 [Bacteroidota bacterium]|jgi:PKD repeat protein
MKNSRWIQYSLPFVFLGLFGGCKPQEADKIELGAKPKAAFEVVATANPNKFTLRSTSTGAFLYKWDLGDGTTSDSTVANATYARRGTYRVKLTAFGNGGFDTTSTSIVVAQDDPTACSGNMRLLTGCGTKRWKLAPEAAALWVGPDATFGTTWWANAVADIPTRVCQFNDEYVFSSDGTFIYDSKGDFWADSDNSGNVFPAGLGVSVGCQPTSVLPPAYTAWGSASPRIFNINNTELKLTGTGAFLGLYKVGNGVEVQLPQASVTYLIKEITATRLVVYINFGPGFWRFTLVPA